MQFHLHETEPLLDEPRESALDGLSVSVDVPALMGRSGAGFSFVVRVQNSGDSAVRFQRPDDTVQIALTDAAGWPVPVASRPPVALINQGRDREPHANAPRIIELRPAEEYRWSVVLEGMRTGSLDGVAPLRPGTYRARVRVILLAADASLPRERSYKIFESEEFPVGIEDQSARR